MNSASRFFGFVFVPILAFILGTQVSIKSPTIKNNVKAPEEIKKEITTDPEKIKEIIPSLLNRGIDFQLIDEMLAIMDEKYVSPDKINGQEISYGLAKGLVFSLDDPYSAYMTPDESDNFEDTLNGNLEGIGAELTMKSGNVVVVSPLKNSPAMKAGLLPEDIIVKIDNEDVVNLGLNEVVDKIKGEPDTTVVLSVIRKSADDLVDIEIKREKITVESVTLKMNGKIAILEINQFGTNTKDEFEKYLTEAIRKNPTGIILDLRFNSGGFLDRARDVVSLFVEDGKVSIIKSRPPDVENIFVTGKKKTDLPMVVLQNKGSASASEIVAGALQDFERATIIGTNSFGKGTVQEVISLKHGGSLRLTIAKWLTPKNRDINEKGIRPDYFVENTTEDYENDRDPQMDVAIKFLNGEDVSEYLNKKSEDAVIKNTEK